MKELKWMEWNFMKKEDFHESFNEADRYVVAVSALRYIFRIMILKSIYFVKEQNIEAHRLKSQPF